MRKRAGSNPVGGTKNKLKHSKCIGGNNMKTITKKLTLIISLHAERKISELSIAIISQPSLQPKEKLNEHYVDKIAT